MFFYRYLGTTLTFQDLHFHYKCGASTAREIVYEVCWNICHHLKETLIPELTKDDWLKIAQGFKTTRNFPNCLGALDGKHIRIDRPTGSTSEYWNYKKFYSVVLLATCDANYKFTFIDVGAYGSAADSAVFKSSELGIKLDNNTLDIPDPRPITAQGDSLPFVFVADEAFGISKHIMRPFGGRANGPDRLIFNYRLSRARMCIEQAFGILTKKWARLSIALNVSIDHVYLIVQTCCILHNFVRERNGQNYTHFESNDGTCELLPFADGQTVTPGRIYPQAVLQARQQFTEYFNSPEGMIPWQNERACV